MDVCKASVIMANYISSLWIMSIICCQPKSRSTTTVVVVHKYEISTSPWSCPKVGYCPNPLGMFVCLFVVALFIHTQINKHSQNWLKGEFSRRPQSLIGKPTVPSKRFFFHVFFGTSSHFPNISLTFPQDFPGPQVFPPRNKTQETATHGTVEVPGCEDGAATVFKKGRPDMAPSQVGVNGMVVDQCVGKWCSWNLWW
jgi:hypothetical protein